MKIVNVKDAIDREPFKPLIVELDSGKQIKVPHRDFVSLSPSGSTAVIFENKHVHIVDVDHISAITLQRRGQSSSR